MACGDIKTQRKLAYENTHYTGDYKQEDRTVNPLITKGDKDINHKVMKNGFAQYRIKNKYSICILINE